MGCVAIHVVPVNKGKRFTRFLKEFSHEINHLLSNLLGLERKIDAYIASFIELVEPEEHKLLGADGSSTDVRYVGKPYSSLEVSSNMSDINKLTDGNTGSYWQSDGAARSHWIR